MAGHFHLRAQMKVTKAKGLTRSESSAPARGFGRRRAVQLVATRVRDEERMHRLFVLDDLSIQVTRDFANRVLWPERADQIVFRPFALVTFIWARK